MSKHAMRLTKGDEFFMSISGMSAFLSVPVAVPARSGNGRDALVASLETEARQKRINISDRL
jgi:hypothetical protein